MRVKLTGEARQTYLNQHPLAYDPLDDELFHSVRSDNASRTAVCAHLKG